MRVITPPCTYELDENNLTKSVVDSSLVVVLNAHSSVSVCLFKTIIPKTYGMNLTDSRLGIKRIFWEITSIWHLLEAEG